MEITLTLPAPAPDGQASPPQPGTALQGLFIRLLSTLLGPDARKTPGASGAGDPGRANAPGHAGDRPAEKEVVTDLEATRAATVSGAAPTEVVLPAAVLSLPGVAFHEVAVDLSGAQQAAVSCGRAVPVGRDVAAAPEMTEGGPALPIVQSPGEWHAPAGSSLPSFELQAGGRDRARLLQAPAGSSSLLSGTEAEIAAPEMSGQAASETGGAHRGGRALPAASPGSTAVSGGQAQAGQTGQQAPVRNGPQLADVQVIIDRPHLPAETTGPQPPATVSPAANEAGVSVPPAAQEVQTSVQDVTPGGRPVPAGGKPGTPAEAGSSGTTPAAAMESPGIRNAGQDREPRPGSGERNPLVVPRELPPSDDRPARLILPPAQVVRGEGRQISPALQGGTGQPAAGAMSTGGSLQRVAPDRSQVAPAGERVPGAGPTAEHVPWPVNVPSGSQQPLPAQIAVAVIRHIEHLQQQPGRPVRVEVALEPPELGRITIRLTLVRGELVAQFYTGDASTRDALAASLPQLRDALAQHNIWLGQAAVFLGQDGHAGNAAQAWVGRAGFGWRSNAEADAVRPDVDGGRDSSGLVNYLA